MMDGKIKTERVVLLGLVTILGATATVTAAAAALVISAAAALVVCGAGLLIRTSETVSEAMRWSVLVTVGFGVSWILGSVVSHVLVLPEGTPLFLKIAGVVPIVYYAVGRRAADPEGASRHALGAWIVFGGVVLGTGVVREALGRGTIFGFLIVTGYAIPADFFASPVGAFLVPGAIVLGARLLSGFATTENEGGRA